MKTKAKKTLACAVLGVVGVLSAVTASATTYELSVTSHGATQVAGFLDDLMIDPATAALLRKLDCARQEGCIIIEVSPGRNVELHDWIVQPDPSMWLTDVLDVI